MFGQISRDFHVTPVTGTPIDQVMGDGRSSQRPPASTTSIAYMLYYDTAR